MGGPHFGVHTSLPRRISSPFFFSKSFTRTLYTMTLDLSANGIAAMSTHFPNDVTPEELPLFFSPWASVNHFLHHQVHALSMGLDFMV